MITLGTAKEMYKLEGYPAELKDDVQSMLNILDINYGENREYFKVGGFVGIVVICGDFQKLFSLFLLLNQSLAFQIVPLNI